MAEKVQAKLAGAIERVNAVARKAVVKSASIQRAVRELLVDRGYLQEICKGWYHLTRPTDTAGDSTGWYSTFWDFVSVYFEERLGTDYCLSAGSSLDLHTAGSLIPNQVTALTARGGTVVLKLPHNTSLVVYLDPKNLPREVEVVRGVRAMPLAMALCRVQPSFFGKQPLSAEIALRAVKSIDDLVWRVLESESPALAGRLAGAYQFLGDAERAEQIVGAVRAAGIGCEPENPFTKPVPMLSATPRLASAYAGRIHGLFQHAREPVLEVLEDMSPRSMGDPQAYLGRIEAIYEHDAYNSLSIEGYRVTPELIEKIRLGSWNPDGNPEDRQQVAAMAAKGYLEAFRLTQQSIRRVLEGDAAGEVFRKDYP